MTSVHLGGPWSYLLGFDEQFSVANVTVEGLRNGHYPPLSLAHFKFNDEGLMIERDPRKFKDLPIDLNFPGSFVSEDSIRACYSSNDQLAYKWARELIEFRAWFCDTMLASQVDAVS